MSSRMDEVLDALAANAGSLSDDERKLLAASIEAAKEEPRKQSLAKVVHVWSTSDGQYAMLDNGRVVFRAPHGAWIEEGPQIPDELRAR